VHIALSAPRWPGLGNSRRSAQPGRVQSDRWRIPAPHDDVWATV